jgi:hypothetical protein
VGGSDYHLPVLDGVRHFVRAPYLREAHTSDDENQQSGDVLHRLLGLVLVPVTVPSAATTILITSGNLHISITITVGSPSVKIKSDKALARTPRVLHPGVLSRTNQVTSRTLDFLVFVLVSKVTTANKSVFRPYFPKFSFFLRNSVSVFLPTQEFIVAPFQKRGSDTSLRIINK